MHQHCVLHHVPVVGRQHILRPLVQNGVEGMAGDIEGHGVGTRIEVHLVKVGKIIKIGHNPAGGRVVFQVIEYPIHLIKLAFRVLMPNGKLITIGFADGTALICPGIPDVGV